jgi:hypothetical protein
MKRLEHSAATELEMLRQAVAASPIQVASWPASPAIVPDWQDVRHSNNIDALILAWIASHVRGAGDRRAH